MILDAARRQAGGPARSLLSSGRQSSRSDLTINTVCGPGPLPSKVETMTRLSAVRIVGVPLQAVLLYRWLIDKSGRPSLEDGAAVFRIEARYAPSLDDFARLYPGEGARGQTTRRSVARWLKALREAGLVETTRTKVGNGYVIRVPAEVIGAFRGKASMASGGTEHPHPDDGLAPPQDGTGPSERWDEAVPQIGRGRPSDRTRPSHAVSGRQNKQNIIINARPTAHSLQEAIPPNGPDDVDLDGGKVGKALEALEGLRAETDQASRALSGMHGTDEAKGLADRTGKALDAVLAGVSGIPLSKPDFNALKAKVKVIINLRHRLNTGHTVEGLDGYTDKYLSRAGLDSGTRSEAVEALQAIGAGEATIGSLIGQNAPQAILQAVNAAKGKGSPVGYVIQTLRNRRERAMA